MTEMVLLVGYTLLFVWIFYRYKIYHHTGLAAWQVLSLFIIKVLVGCINLRFHTQEYITNDVGFYHWQSVTELSQMKNNPKAFLKDWLFNWGELYTHLNPFQKENAVFWTDLGRLFHTKFMNLANILSFGNLYVNVVFYNVLYFLGSLQLYKFFYRLQPPKKYYFLLSIFLFPSILFWTSGIHKDGWVMAILGIILFGTLQTIEFKRTNYRIMILVGLFMLMVVRYFYFFVFLPFYLIGILFMLYNASPSKWMRIFFWSTCILFICYVVFPDNVINQFLLGKQTEFLTLKGYSEIRLPILSGNYKDGIQGFFMSFWNVLLEPMSFMFQGTKYFLATIDNLLYLSLIIFLLFRLKKQETKWSLFILILMLFSISILYMIGCTVNTAGAIVRYKSVFTSITLCVLFYFADTKEVSLQLHNIVRRLGILKKD